MKKDSCVSLRLLSLLVFCTALLPGAASAATPQIVTGTSHTVALKADGTVWTWGGNGSGQLCDSSRGLADPTPLPIPNLGGDVIAVAAYQTQTFAVKSDGSLWACGTNGLGELGLGYAGANVTSIQPALSSIVVNTALGAAAIAAGEQHTLVIQTDGTVIAFGKNLAGQLGIGSKTLNSLTPVAVSTLTNVVAVAAGQNHSMARTADGLVHTWGANGSGQLGHGDTVESLIPKTIASLSGIQVIRSGPNHSLALATNGTVYAWGLNTFGPLGDGTIATKLSPTQVIASGSLVTDISTNKNHSLAVKSNGTVMGWGLDSPIVSQYNSFNARGTLGQGNPGTSALNQLSPVSLSNWGATVVSVQAGWLFSVALLSDNTLRSSGENESGQLGDNNLASSSSVFRTTPAAVLDELDAYFSLAGCSGPDSDLDTVPDMCDNCTGDSNLDQADFDADGIGDVCDACPSTLPMRVLGKSDYWQGIQRVYDFNAVSADTIQIQGSYISGPVVFDLVKDITIQGGFDCDYNNNSGAPSLIESITIDSPSRSVTLDNIATN